MKDLAIQVCSEPGTDGARRNRLREYLQHAVLRAMFEREMLDGLVFHGGTGLRILHDLPRYSEDLDFHTAGHGGDFDLGPAFALLGGDLERSGYEIALAPKLEGNVQSCAIKFVGLLHECGLSPRAEARLSVKLEIDRRPPAGFGMEVSSVDLYFPYVLRHHDRRTFIAGKLHAVLQRPYAKGRDYYDLMFYLNRWRQTGPNVAYLVNALQQTGYEGEAVTADNWRRVVAARVEAVDWLGVLADVDPFLLREADATALRKDRLLQLLGE